MKQKQATILIIEDEPAMRTMLETFLASQGYTIVTAEHGEEGLTRYAECDPDVILCDLKMPVMDGMTFLKTIHSQQPDATVIILTAFATLENAIAAMREGAYDYITKPVDDLVNDLLKKIEIAVERSRLMRENKTLSSNLEVANADLEKRNHEMEAQLEMAGVVQQSILPMDTGKGTGFTWACKRNVAEHVSGDFYDIQKVGPAQFSIMMGQVFGRDVPSSLLMSMIMATIRGLQQRNSDPLAVMNKANVLIKRYLEKGFQNFVTVFYGILDKEQNVFRYATASHPGPILARYKVDELSTQTLNGRGNYLGKYQDAELSLEEVGIRYGDLLILFTENAVNTQNDNGEVFGIKRLVASLKGKKSNTPEEILNAMYDRISTHHSKQLIGLDLALMALRVTH